MWADFIIQCQRARTKIRRSPSLAERVLPGISSSSKPWNSCGAERRFGLALTSSQRA
jgi:hypothetical protein